MLATSQYTEFKYLFPPRPETASTSKSIPMLERMGMVAEPKLNGSCALVFTDGAEVVVMNRHREQFSNLGIKKEDLLSLHRGNGWMVLVGEYMNKGQKDVSGKLFNQKFVVFDILVHNSEYLTSSYSEDRRALLNDLYKRNSFDQWIDSVDGSENCYIVKSFKEDLLGKWNEIIKTDMYEGFVFKRPSGRLETGYSLKNNTTWQSKVRKPTKNYSH